MSKKLVTIKIFFDLFLVVLGYSISHYLRYMSYVSYMSSARYMKYLGITKVTIYKDELFETLKI